MDLQNRTILPTLAILFIFPPHLLFYFLVVSRQASSSHSSSEFFGSCFWFVKSEVNKQIGRRWHCPVISGIYGFLFHPGHSFLGKSYEIRTPLLLHTYTEERRDVLDNIRRSHCKKFYWSFVPVPHFTPDVSCHLGEQESWSRRWLHSGWGTGDLKQLSTQTYLSDPSGANL